MDDEDDIECGRKSEIGQSMDRTEGDDVDSVQRKRTEKREDDVEETTTDSEMKDEYTPANIVHLLEEKDDTATTKPFSASKLQELQRHMLDERFAHPSKRKRKPIRPFSPEPPFRKTKRTRKDLLDSAEDIAQDKLLQGDDLLQRDDVAHQESFEEDAKMSSDSEYKE
jgi:hypothetical protein